MEDFNKWTIPELKTLLLQYNITSKDIKGTGKHGNVLKADFIKKVNKTIKNIEPTVIDNFETINEDTCYNILLQSNVENISNLCYINKTCYKSCNDNFWINKIKHDFNISVTIKPENITKWIFLYNQIKKVYDILEGNRITRIIHLKFNVMDDVLYRIAFIFPPSDINFIYMGEDYDNITDQLIRITYENDLVNIQYTEVGKNDYYTINTKIDKIKLTDILIILFYYFPNTNISLI